MTRRAEWLTGTASKSSREIFTAGIDSDLPVALWHLPNNRHIFAALDLSGQPRPVEVDLTSLPGGFVIAPYGQGHGDPAYLVHAQEFWSGTPGAMTRVVNGFQPVDGARTRQVELQSPAEANGHAFSPSRPRISGSTFFARRSDYCKWVQQALHAIDDGVFEKVVLARSQHLRLDQSFRIHALFENLCEAYPNAFVSLVSLPGVGMWIGASPELLLSLHGRTLTTVSLAGTQKAVPGGRIEWQDKELEEQAFVSDYIRDCFARQGIDDYRESKLETMRIGDLLHLRTRYDYTLPKTDGLVIANNLLHDMHPTPAVCGVPKQAAYEFILELEKHDRGFYAGFLGPVNLLAETHLFVNLRCMQVYENSAVLYAGAGITRDSVPEKEWVETELKLNSLRSLLNDSRTNSNGFRAKAAQLCED